MPKIPNSIINIIFTRICGSTHIYKKKRKQNKNKIKIIRQGVELYTCMHVAIRMRTCLRCVARSRSHPFLSRQYEKLNSMIHG